MKKIAGTSGEANFKQIADHIMKFCFNGDLLQQFSFTGISKNKAVPAKPGFNAYPAIIQFIFKVVNRGDRSYSILKNQQYLKNFFKHVRERGLKRRTFMELDSESEIEIAAKIPKLD